jgi:DNA-binding GntR family transcriptional regulator
MNIQKFSHIRIDRRSSLPLYLQLSNAIKSLIVDRVFHYQEPLPTIDEVASLFEVDQDVVDKSYQQLVFENYVIFNDGSYLAYQYDLTANFITELIKLYDAIKMMGLTPSVKTLAQTIVKVDQKFHQKSKFKKGESLLYIRRIYYGNETPLIVLDTYIPLELFPNIETILTDEKPIYDVFAINYHRFVSQSKRLLAVVNLPKDLSSIFKVRTGTAGYFVTSLTYDQHHQQVDYTEGWSSNNYVFQTEVNLQEVKSSYVHLNQDLGHL